jgi:hypothetical protein
MKKMVWPIVFFSLLLSCASLAGRHRLAQFEDAAELYRRTLLFGDFALAARMVDSGGEESLKTEQHVKLLKITNYTSTHVDVSEDQRRILQDVNLEYYRLNTNRLRNIQYRQTWTYDEAQKVWLLKTELPRFD